MRYWVYEDDPTNRAIVHKDWCRFCNYGYGLRGRRLPDNRWHGPFESVEDAFAKARSTGRRENRGCKICAPAGQLGD